MLWPFDAGASGADGADRDAVAAFALGAVQRLVRCAQQVVDVAELLQRALRGQAGGKGDVQGLSAHIGPRHLPKNPRALASWNYVSDRDASRVAVTYSMNRLQGLPDDTPLLVTLNPRQPVEPHQQICERELTHPQFDAAALAAQRALPAVQGHARTYYAGAHFGFGFHEDGLRSGLAAAAALLRDEALGRASSTVGVA